MGVRNFGLGVRGSRVQNGLLKLIISFFSLYTSGTPKNGYQLRPCGSSSLSQLPTMVSLEDGEPFAFIRGNS